MNMFTTLRRRSLRLITTIVVMAMLLAPTASLANCCCVLAKLGRGTGLSTGGCCDRDEAPACCASRAVRELPALRSCCSSRVSDEPTGTPAQVSAMADTLSSPSQCACERSCCDGASDLSAVILNEGDSPRSRHDVVSELAFLFISYDFIPSSFTLGRDRSPRFLSASHRCATLCRWLN